jgi:hypothetical protein
VRDLLPIHARPSSKLSRLVLKHLMVMFTIAAIYQQRPTSTLSAHCRPQQWSSHLGDVLLAVIRRGDPPQHSRGRHRCRRATTRNRCCVAYPSAEVPPVGSEVLPRRSPPHPAPPTASDSSPWPPARRGGRATARSSAAPGRRSRATSRRWVRPGLGVGERRAWRRRLGEPKELGPSVRPSPGNTDARSRRQRWAGRSAVAAASR